MATVLQLITDSLREIGALAQGMTPSNSEAADALRKLNRLVESLAIERAFIYSIRQDTHSLTPGDADYTIGTGGEINVTRPVKIESATVTTSGALTIPLNLLSRPQWDAILQKTAQAPVPENLYDDYAYPLSTIRIHPVPSAAGSTLILATWQQISQFAALTDNIMLAPGYERALMYLFAFELVNEYGRPMPPALPGIAAAAKAGIAQMNLGGGVPAPPPAPAV